MSATRRVIGRAADERRVESRQTMPRPTRRARLRPRRQPFRPRAQPRSARAPPARRQAAAAAAAPAKQTRVEAFPASAASCRSCCVGALPRLRLVRLADDRDAQARPADRRQGRRASRARTTAARSPISSKGPASSKARCCSRIDDAARRQRGALKRGEYEFKAGVSMREVEDELIASKVVQHKLHDSRGPDQRADRPAPARQRCARRRDQGDAARGLAAARHLYVRARRYAPGDSDARWRRRRPRLVDEIWAKRAPDLPIKSPGELVTLASIVEKETGKADERPRVAGVFVNRLQKHMKLQSDPTIVYGLVVRQGHARPSDHQGRTRSGDALQHLHHRRPAAGTDLQSRQGGDGGGRQSRCAPRNSISSPTAPAATPSPRRSTSTSKNVARWRQIEKDAKDRLAPDAAPCRRARRAPPRTARSTDPDPTLVRRARPSPRRRPAGRRRAGGEARQRSRDEPPASPRWSAPAAPVGGEARAARRSKNSASW